MPVVMYGIKNCDTIKRAREWLDKHGVAYAFHDYRTAGVDQDRLERWCKTVGWEMLLNRVGLTFRKLPESDKSGLNERRAVGLMLAQPAMIKRPVLEFDSRMLVGFKPEVYAKNLARVDG